MKDMIAFINDCKSAKAVKIFKQSISNLKNRHLIWRPEIRSKETPELIDHVTLRFPHFNADLFQKQLL